MAATTRMGTVNTGSNIDGEEEKQGKVKKTRVKRALYHQEVEAEKTQGQSVAGNRGRRMTLFHWDCAWGFLSHSVSNEKDGISGPHTVRRVQSWMSTIQAPGQPLQTWEGLGSSQSCVTITNTEFTTSSGCQTEPMLSSDDGLRYRMSSEPNEGEYCDALANLLKRSDQFPSMDGADVDMYPPPSHGYYDNDDNDNTDQGRYILATPEDAQLVSQSTNHAIDKGFGIFSVSRFSSHVSDSASYST
ncbi:hypothetical protein EDB92DRAFT_1821149 [Lactarius akahatsu]|uniref:Uncharacterized protein n=1 Tax=Lactarius akahatsu TaxID=416441 RepID=A0AAD4L6U2_9AGAM|nr:hypothetical protein EDB92DRAFT_1821149 [Lactarius akahatsu]